MELRIYPLSNKDKQRGIILPSTLSTKLAYFIGILIGDGNIQYRPYKNEYSIKCVGNPKDEMQFYDEILNPIVKDLFGISPNMRYHDNSTTYGFRLYSKSLYIFLTNTLNLWEGKKGLNLHIPHIFIENKRFTKSVVKGIFDTDGCISFKKKYRKVPYYPVITLSSKSKMLIMQVSVLLKKWGFSIVEIYDYNVKDKRIERGFTTINRIELNGQKNLQQWLDLIGFDSPKHLNKIKKWRG
ncbi:hypothetical protein GOV09_06320 [Candidatus Woesearchaeota archaeon]|nr:hypothetical protein [Candidatus Woesearchaeota archaeon]